MDQPDSRLFQTPLEIRQAILSHVLPTELHLHLHADRIDASLCSVPENDCRSTCCTYATKHKKYDGWERGSHRRGNTYGQTANDREVWARRLRSTWGPHWRCEQKAKDGLKVDMSILLVCKKLYNEGIDFMSRITVINITDLIVLEYVTERKLDMPSPSSNYLLRIFEQGITRLNITLRWPLGAFRALEAAPTSLPRRMEEEMGEFRAGEIWTRVGERLSTLKRLTSLRLWFDHSDPSTWALVNEKALLEPLITQMSTITVDVVIILPKLHPLHEHDNRHFLQDTYGGRIRLYRVLRQRWHSSEDDNGGVEVIYKPDFPFSIDVIDDMSLEETEAWERQAFKDGSDVEAIVEDLRPENNNVR